MFSFHFVLSFIFLDVLLYLWRNLFRFVYVCILVSEMGFRSNNDIDRFGSENDSY